MAPHNTPARMSLVQLVANAVQLSWCLTVALYGFGRGVVEAVLSSRMLSATTIFVSGFVCSMQFLFAYASFHTKHVLFRILSGLYRAVLPLECTDSVTPSGVPYLYMRLPDPARLRSDPDLVILHIHGGAMVMGTPAMHMPALLTLIKLLERRNVKADIVSLDYSLAPANPFPAAVDEVCSTITWIRDKYSDGVAGKRPAVVLFGDSAGGNLALAGLLALHRQRINTPTMPNTTTPTIPTTNFLNHPTPIPTTRTSTTPSREPFVAGAVLMSPWLDLSSCWTTGSAATISKHHIYPCHESSTPGSCSCVTQQMHRLKADMLTPETLTKAARMYTQGTGTSLTDPLVSPGLTPPEECAAALRDGVSSLPVLVTAGSNEILLPDQVKWHDMVTKADPGVVRLIIERGAVHDYPLLPTQEYHLTPVVEYMVTASSCWAKRCDE